MLGTRAGSNERRYQPGFHQQEIPVGEMGTQEFYVFFRIPPILWVNGGIPVGENRAGTSPDFTNRNVLLVESCVRA